MATGRVTTVTGRAGQASGRVTTVVGKAFAAGGVTGRVTAIAGRATNSTVGRLTAVVGTTTSPGGVVVPELVDLEPGVLVSISPVIAGVTPTSIVWSCSVAGVALVQDPSTGLLTYKPPATRAGTSLVWRCTVTYPGGTLTATGQHDVLPHAGGWMAKADGSGLFPVCVGALLPGQGYAPTSGGSGSVPATVTANV